MSTASSDTAALAEQRIVAACAAGAVADFADGGPVDLDDIEESTRWGAERQVSGEFLLDLLSRTDSRLHPRGVRVRGGRIAGDCTWDWQELRAPLELIDCVLDSPLVLDCARLAGLTLRNCRVPRLSGRELETSHGFDLTASSIPGGIDLTEAQITGSLRAPHAQLGTPEAADDALSADGLRVSGDVYLGGGFTATGEVRLFGAHIGGDLSCSEGTFTNPGGSALSADRAEVAGGVFLRRGFAATGEVRLLGAHIGGDVSCSEGTFSNPGGIALSADRAEVAGSVFLRRGFAATGEVRLPGAHIGGDVSCSEGTFSNPGGIALSADRAEVTGSVFLRQGFTATGEVRLHGARVGGSLECGGGTFSNPGGNALSADRAEVTGSVFLRQGFTATGEVRLLGAHIGGDLSCIGGRFINPGRDALFADGAEVTGGVLLRRGFTATGEVRLRGAHIGGTLGCEGGTFDAGSGYALDLEGVTITGALRWRDLAAPSRGIVDLTRATVSELNDDAAAWPARGMLLLTGFTYARIADSAPRDPQQRLDWIRRQADYNPQPYQQLAAVYRQAGHLDEARDIAMARRDDLRVRGDLSRPERTWNRFLGISIGHGYHPARAVWALVGLFILTAIPVWIGASNNAFVQVGNTPDRAVTSSHCGAGYPCLSWPAYALEDITPIINLHESENWQPDRSRPWGWALRDWLDLATILGWIGTTLLIAALTGLARVD